MRTKQLAGTLLFGTLLVFGCADNSPTEVPHPDLVRGQPDPLPGPPDVPGRPESPGPPEEVCIPFESLAGEWTAESFTFEGGQNLIHSELLFVLTFFSDGTSSEFISGDTNHSFCDGATSCTEEGNRYIQTDVNLLICDPGCGAILEYTLSGNTLTIFFDGGEDGTPFTATFVRTSDAGPPNQSCGPAESIVGTWTATSFIFEGGPDLVADANLVLIVTFNSDGTFTEFVDNDSDNLFCDGTTCEDDGRYIQTDVNLVTCDPECGEILDYTISGNTLNISLTETEVTPFTATFESN